ncbi:hypothetical protein Nepgr_033352 [Nepenthes gracilis]|uniref:Uncharacterized protein n=1 Tax=Nepenthes gracilis TaxID=150966 RepID=A0AAD3TLR3_NEPGR|nr:hypothetical protein Nepgr_033352 [Nepenthes gracilis]
MLMSFVLDLRSLLPQLLGDVQQCLLQVANLYAVSAIAKKRRNSDFLLEDRIGLFYLQRIPVSSSVELKIAYSPRRRSFSLGDFHHAISNLPTDSYSPQLEDSGPVLFHDLDFSHILSEEVLCSSTHMDTKKKVILISSCLVGNMDSATRKILLDAANTNVYVEFVFFEQMSVQLSDVPENVRKFEGDVCDIQNCSFHACLPDAQVFLGLVNRWLQELKDDIDKEMQARIIFQRNILGSINQILCDLCITVNQIINEFSPCEVVEQTILHLPSLMSWPKLQEVCSPIDLNIVERTNLASLCEGVMIGIPHIVIPSACHGTDAVSEEIEKFQLNNQLFQGLCQSLYSLDQGLVCRSSCNIETMRETGFYHYYILQPSNSRWMILRRLAGAEDILPLPDVNLCDASTLGEIACSIKESLQEVKLRNYNPLQHGGGFHQKLNSLVKESLQSRLVPTNCISTASNSRSNVPSLRSDLPIDLEVVAEKSLPSDDSRGEDKDAACFTREWEQLIIDKTSIIYSPASASNSWMEKSEISPPTTDRPSDVRTWRILERLEAPRRSLTQETTLGERVECLQAHLPCALAVSYALMHHHPPQREPAPCPSSGS